MADYIDLNCGTTWQHRVLLSQYAQQQQQDLLNQLHQRYGSLRDSAYGHVEEYRIQKEKLIKEINKRDKIIKELENRINRFKKGQYMKSDYFRSNGECQEHREYNCQQCMNDYLEQKNGESSRSLTIVASSLAGDRDGSLESEDMQMKAKIDLNRKTRFIKKSLGKTDEEIKKMRIKDLAKHLSRAQEEITVGGMEELLEEDTKESGGFIKGIVKFFLKGGHK